MRKIFIFLLLLFNCIKEETSTQYIDPNLYREDGIANFSINGYTSDMKEYHIVYTFRYQCKDAYISFSDALLYHYKKSLFTILDLRARVTEGYLVKKTYKDLFINPTGYKYVQSLINNQLGKENSNNPYFFISLESLELEGKIIEVKNEK